MLYPYFYHKKLTVKFEKIKKKEVIDTSTDNNLSSNFKIKATYL